MARRSRGRTEAASDVDEELFSYFNGFYTGELGLRSAMGSALERASFKLGLSSGHVHDGFDDSVRFGVVGPGGYIEGGRVARALSVIAGPAPLVTLTEKELEMPKEEQKRRLGVRKKIAAEWPYYIDVLRGYYTRREPGVFEGLIKPYATFAGAVMLSPAGIEYVAGWRRAHRDEEIAEFLITQVKSVEEAKKRLQECEDELLRVELVKSPDWRLRAARLRKTIAASKRLALPDSIDVIRRKWDAPTELHAIAALRTLAKRAESNKDTPDRAEARRLQYEMRAQTEGLWRSAREAYVRAKRDGDRDIRETTEARKKQREEAELSEYAPKLRFIPADQD